MKQRVQLSFVFGLVMCVSIPLSVAAHPHVWATVETKIEISAKKEIVAIHHKWAFDEDYSKSVVNSLEADKDGKYSRDTLQPMANVNVEELKKYDYFTYPVLGKDKVAFASVKNVHLEYLKDVLVLEFELPLKTGVPIAKAKDFSFTIFDPTFFVDMGLAETAPVSIAAPASVHCTPTLLDPPPVPEQTLSQAFQEADANTPSSLGSLYAKKISLKCGGEGKS